MIRGEYWIMPDGSCVYADSDNGDKGHEAIVIETIIDKVCEVLGIDNDFECDAVYFRTSLYDGYFDQNEDDPWPKVEEAAVRKGVFTSKEVTPAFDLIRSGSPDDARAFAINYWRWIRVAGLNAEVPDMSERTLKRLGEGMLNAGEEEGVLFDGDEIELMNSKVKFSTYDGSRGGIREATIGELLSGEAGGGHSDLERTSKDVLRRADVALQPSFYGSHLGDSLTIIRNTLLEAYAI